MALSDTSLERISSLFVERGLYILRYDSSESANNGSANEAPLAMVRPAGGCEATIQIITPPGIPAGELPVPGSCAVVFADAGGALHVSVRRRDLSGSLDASLRLEALSRPSSLARNFTGGVTELRRSELAPKSIRSPPIFVVMGHVAHRGDIEVAQGEWIAGPDSPSPIEGVEIRGSQGSPVLVETQVLIAERSPKWSKWTQPGSFAGSRGHSLPLAGVRFRLRGTGSDGYELTCEALFLGAPILTKHGSEIELASANADDPLVGLRLDLRRVASASAATQEAEITREPRVRVFRAAEAR